MLQDSLDALCALIISKFPEIQTIYTNTMPEPFKRPSFFVMLATNYSDDLCKAMYQTGITWQIVYFAPLEKGHWPDPYSQLAANDKLQTALMEAMTLTGPSGVVYHILDVEGGPRDNEVYITVRLEAEQRRTEATYDLISTVDHVLKEGN